MAEKDIYHLKSIPSLKYTIVRRSAKAVVLKSDKGHMITVNLETLEKDYEKEK